MAKFIDALSREWTIEISGPEIKMLRRELDLDLLAALDQEANVIDRLSDDTILLVDCISLLLSDQIQKLGLDEKGFAIGLRGSGLKNALDALVEELILFFPPRQGQVLRTMWEQAEKVGQMASERAIAIAPKLMEKAVGEMDLRLSKWSD